MHRVRTENMTVTPKESDTNRIALGFTGGQANNAFGIKLSKRSQSCLGNRGYGPGTVQSTRVGFGVIESSYPIWTLLAMGRQVPSKSDWTLVVAKELLSEIRRYHIFPNALREPQRTSAVFPLNEDAGNLGSVLDEMIKKRDEDFKDYSRP